MLEILSVILMIAVDQLVKLWASGSLKPIEDIPVWKGVFHLTYVENTGAAFSILQGQSLILKLIPTIACIAIIYILVTKKIKNRIGKWSLLFILSGAIGNLIDRVLRGYVVDLFNLKIIHFAIFNVADILVNCGAALLFLYILFFSDRRDIAK